MRSQGLQVMRTHDDEPSRPGHSCSIESLPGAVVTIAFTSSCTRFVVARLIAFLFHALADPFTVRNKLLPVKIPSRNHGQIGLNRRAYLARGVPELAEGEAVRL